MSELVIKNVSKSFAAVKALDKVNFSACMGEVHAVLGENGAGKSTLIKILSGVLEKDEGEIYFNNKLLKIKSPKEAIKEGIGTVYQELSLIKDLTVAQNIFFENWPKNKANFIGSKVLNDKAKVLLEKYKIEGIEPDTKAGELTLSQQQMVEIVKILARAPKVIILDEATSALTENKVVWLLSLAKQLANENKLVIFISHRLQEINDSCDRITVFRNGKDVGVKEVKETNNEELVAMMLGRKLTSYFPVKTSFAYDKALLEIRNANVGKILKDINLKLYKGEVLGVGGLAGQGQLSLFLMLFGTCLYSGEILLEEKLITLKCPSDSLNHGIALVPEDRATEGLVQTMTVKENISLSALKKFSKAGFIKKSFENEQIQAAISKLNIKSAGEDAKVMELSGGNQQKVLLSKFLILNPKIYLLFDSTRGVDVGTKAEIFTLVRKLAEEGNAVLYYSTDIEELVNVCDRVAVMCDNTIAGILTQQNITKENILRLSVGETYLAN